MVVVIALMGALLQLFLWIGSYCYMQRYCVAITKVHPEIDPKEPEIIYVRYNGKSISGVLLYCAHYPIKMVHRKFFVNYGHETVLEG